MNDHDLKRERRKQKALERLGTNTPQCPFCGIDEPLVFELHHVSGRAFGDDMIPVCRNCHRILSDWQKDHPPTNGSSPSDPERIAHFLLGLADMFELLVKRLREFAKTLFALETHSQDESGEAQP
jgi:hypothetical protein